MVGQKRNLAERGRARGFCRGGRSESRRVLIKVGLFSLTDRTGAISRWTFSRTDVGRKEGYFYGSSRTEVGCKEGCQQEGFCLTKELKEQKKRESFQGIFYNWPKWASFSWLKSHGWKRTVRWSVSLPEIRRNEGTPNGVLLSSIVPAPKREGKSKQRVSKGVLKGTLMCTLQGNKGQLLAGGFLLAQKSGEKKGASRWASSCPETRKAFRGVFFRGQRSKEKKVISKWLSSSPVPQDGKRKGAPRVSFFSPRSRKKRRVKGVTRKGSVSPRKTKNGEKKKAGFNVGFAHESGLCSGLSFFVPREFEEKKRIPGQVSSPKSRKRRKLLIQRSKNQEGHCFTKQNGFNGGNASKKKGNFQVSFFSPGSRKKSTVLPSGLLLDHRSGRKEGHLLVGFFLPPASPRRQERHRKVGFLSPSFTAKDM